MRRGLFPFSFGTDLEQSTMTSKIFTILSAAALLAASGAAQAACPAVAGPATLAAGADVLEVEGPVSAIELTDRTVTVIGTCVRLPAGLLIDTDADDIGDITLDQLVDPTLYSPIGGTIILTGTAALDATGNISYTADSVFFEFGEHVLVGPLVSVDATAETFVVAGTTVQMNTDPRMPGELWDLGGNTIDVADMVGYEGTLAAAEGYFRSGVHNARLVETEVIVTTVGVDTVAISRADYRTSKRSVDVRGQVTAQTGSGAFAGTVNIDLACNGTIDNVATVIVDPVVNLGDFRWTSANNVAATNPGSVCVTSPLGGSSSRTFFIR
jgi:hypothetical protein